MSQDTICKTVHQYNKEPVSDEDMKRLQEIANDYSKVKNYVYGRYGGIASLPKLYPGYTIQNEMTKSGLRAELGLPSVYFYLAVFDALRDIKCQWTKTKSKVLSLIAKNERLTADDKHYLRFVLKVNNAFEAVLNNTPMKFPSEIQRHYENLAEKTDTTKMNRYLCRQVRKYHMKQYTEQVSGFAVAERAYRYADHGIYISVKEKRKRIFIPLTDSNRYKSQLYIKLYPDQNRIEIKVPVNVTVCMHEDYTNQVAIAFGIFAMFTTDTGHVYGERLGIYQTEYVDWMRQQTVVYNRNRKSNSGRKKYYAKKKRFEEQMHSYINHEINRFIQTEKPHTIYLVKLPKVQSRGVNRRINQVVTMWQRGYIRRRLNQKCKEQSVEITEVLGNDISRECSYCGAKGTKKDGEFICESCGYHIEEKVNTAKNILHRGLTGKTIK